MWFGESSMRTPWRVWLVELFAAGNLAFLSVDLLLAHAVNRFAHPAEWVPVYFGGLVLLLIPGLLLRRHRDGVFRILGLTVGWASVLLGVVGLLFHLQSRFFVENTLKALVYSAPFAAPLAYTGVGCLLLLNRLEPEDSPDWGPWVVLLALGGFVGNFALSLCDHAQNGFHDGLEWVPVFAAAFAVGFLLVAMQRAGDAFFLKLCLVLMAVQAAVGVWGAGLHVWADIHGPASSLRENVLNGAPPFAPLLFTNLALLAGIGLWDMLARTVRLELQARDVG
jgi:hypothetical protein